MRRFEIINWFIKEYEYKSYLEIGIDNPGNCFNHIECSLKASVDPAKGKTNGNHYCMTSDKYFSSSSMRFDIVFVDGLHESKQVLRDINNSLRCLNAGGTIVVHDCNPLSAVAAAPNRIGKGLWNGDVWKAFAHLRASNLYLKMATVDTDHGCGIIQNTLCAGGYKKHLPYNGPRETYQNLDDNRARLLNLITPNRMKENFAHVTK